MIVKWTRGRASGSSEGIGEGGQLEFEVEGPADIQRVSRAFNDMQGCIGRLIGDQARAFEAISHDLRTPLGRFEENPGGGLRVLLYPPPPRRSRQCWLNSWSVELLPGRTALLTVTGNVCDHLAKVWLAVGLAVIGTLARMLRTSTRG